MNQKLAWVLLISLLVNAALVGFMIGNHGRNNQFAFFNRHIGGPGQVPSDMMMQRPDDATRGILKQSFDAERDNLRKALKDVVDARRESEEILRADPLDTAKLDAALAKLRANSSAAQESFHRALRDAATKLNGEQRKKLGRFLERAPSGRISGGGPLSGGITGIINEKLAERFGKHMDYGDMPPPPPPGDMYRPLPDGMGLGAPAPPEE